jgi:hypothetical protein
VQVIVLIEHTTVSSERLTNLEEWEKVSEEQRKSISGKRKKYLRLWEKVSMRSGKSFRELAGVKDVNRSVKQTVRIFHSRVVLNEILRFSCFTERSCTRNQNEFAFDPTFDGLLARASFHLPSGLS